MKILKIIALMIMAISWSLLCTKYPFEAIGIALLLAMLWVAFAD